MTKPHIECVNVSSYVDALGSAGPALLTGSQSQARPHNPRNRETHKEESRSVATTDGIRNYLRERFSSLFFPEKTLPPSGPTNQLRHRIENKLAQRSLALAFPSISANHEPRHVPAPQCPLDGKPQRFTP